MEKESKENVISSQLPSVTLSTISFKIDCTIFSAHSSSVVFSFSPDNQR